MPLKNLFYILLFTTLCFGCDDTPIFSEIPHITFKSFTNVENGALLTIEFKDGDGDIGVKLDGNGIPKGSDKNLQVTYYRKADGVYRDIYSFISPSDTNYIVPHYQVPDVTPLGQNQVLQGFITVNIVNPWIDPKAISGDTIKYNIVLFDRTGNNSNTASTGDIIID